VWAISKERELPMDVRNEMFQKILKKNIFITQNEFINSLTSILKTSTKNINNDYIQNLEKYKLLLHELLSSLPNNSEDTILPVDEIMGIITCNETTNSVLMAPTPKRKNNSVQKTLTSNFYATETALQQYVKKWYS